LFVSIGKGTKKWKAKEQKYIFKEIKMHLIVFIEKNQLYFLI